MKALRIVPALAAAALLIAPVAASAQNAPWQWQQNGQWQNNQDQRHRHDDGDRDNRSNNGYDNGYNNGYGRNNGNQLSGRVSSFSPFNLYLDNGRHVELHQGTVISPTGATPQPGQRAQVQGHWNNDGSFSADAIYLR